MLLLNPRRTRTNMKLLQLVWIFLLTLCGQSAFIKIQVKEDDEVILDCSFGRNIENGAFDWKKDVDKSNEDVFWYSGGQTDPGKEFTGRVSYFPDQLRFGNASIKITKAKPSDSGNYTCYHAIVKREVKSTVSLTVDPILKPRPEIEGAAPRPIITLHKTNNGMLLQCEVLGAFPKPEVQWWDSDGNVLAVGDPQIRDGKVNKYDTVLNVTVNKSGDYRCVSTQDDIHHQIYTKTHVPGGASKPSVTIFEGTKDGVLLRCEVFGASPELQVSWKNRAGQDVSTKEPQKTETGDGYDIILETTVKKTDYYRCVTTEGKKDDEVHSEIHVVVPGDTPNNSVNGVVGIVGSVIAVVAIIAAIVVVLYFRRHYKQRFRGPTPTPAASSSKEEIL